MEQMKLVACVTLYHPADDVAANIRSYIDVADRLYLIDNGDGELVTAALQAEFSQVEVIRYPENMGIARPLNDVLRLVDGRYDYLLTMDQDSHFAPGSAQRYVTELARLVSTGRTDLLGLSPAIIGDISEAVASADIHWQRERTVITSGNIVDVAQAIAIGGFDERLFIDEVDIDFSLRGYFAGCYQYSCDAGIYLVHHLGDPQPVRLLGRTYHPPMHNYIRTYYIIRNRIYMLRKYRHIAWGLRYHLWVRSTLRLLASKLFFEKDRWRKIKSILAALRDGVLGRMGKKSFGN